MTYKIYFRWQGTHCHSSWLQTDKCSRWISFIQTCNIKQVKLTYPKVKSVLRYLLTIYKHWHESECERPRKDIAPGFFHQIHSESIASTCWGTTADSRYISTLISTGNLGWRWVRYLPEHWLLRIIRIRGGYCSSIIWPGKCASNSVSVCLPHRGAFSMLEKSHQVLVILCVVSYIFMVTEKGIKY